MFADSKFTVYHGSLPTTPLIDFGRLCDRGSNDGFRQRVLAKKRGNYTRPRPGVLLVALRISLRIAVYSAV